MNPKHPIKLLPLLLCAAALLSVGCAADAPLGADADDPELGFEGGAPADVDGAFDATLGKADLGYTQPTDLPELVDPEVIVSIDGLTLHLFDRATGFSRVYEVGLGRIGSSGRSHTPVGHFTTAADASNGWWNMAARWSPEYYVGLPFIRFSKRNGDGAYTYGLHGPVTETLRVGYVSGGCVRMHPDDIVELFWNLRAHPGASISIQQELELDAAGEQVEFGREAALFDPDVAIEYGASLGPRVNGFIGDACETDAQCGDYAAASDSFCHTAGFCSQGCEGACPDLTGKPPTFCGSGVVPGSGACVPVADEVNGSCATVDGTAPMSVSRFVGESGASAVTRTACAPVAGG